MVGKILIIVAFIFLLFWVLLNKQKTNNPSSAKLVLNQKIINLEVADNNQTRALGLSNRPSLCPACGMLFIFDKPGVYPFWMKDTLIPLDMLWLDQDKKIVDIKTAQPEPNKQPWQLQLYQNTSLAKYVLELNQNFAKDHNLKTGNQLEIRF